MAKARRVRTRRGMLRRYVAGAPSAGRGAAQPAGVAGYGVAPAPSVQGISPGQIEQIGAAVLAATGLRGIAGAGIPGARLAMQAYATSMAAYETQLQREYERIKDIMSKQTGFGGNTQLRMLTLPADMSMAEATAALRRAGLYDFGRVVAGAAGHAFVFSTRGWGDQQTRALAALRLAGEGVNAPTRPDLLTRIMGSPYMGAVVGAAAVGASIASLQVSYQYSIEAARQQLGAQVQATLLGGGYVSPHSMVVRSQEAELQAKLSFWDSLARMPVVGWIPKWAANARELRRQIGELQGEAMYEPKARLLRMYGLQPDEGIARQSTDYRLAVAAALAPWGQRVARGLSPSKAELGLPPDVWAAAASTIGSLGMQTWAGSVRHGLLSGASLASLAESAAPLLVAQGDLAGLATLRPLLGGRRHERLLRTAARGIDLRAAAELAGLQAGLATGEVTLGQAEGRALADLPTGGATQALWQAATQLGRVADWMAKQVGAEHPLTLAARGQELSALTQLAEWHTSLRLGRLDETLQRANVRLSGYGVAAAMLPLSAVPEAGLQLWGAQASIQQDQLAAIRRTAAAFPNGPIRWELEAQANDLEASMVAGYLSAQQGAQAMRGVWHQYGQALRLPGIARQMLFAPRAGVLGRIAMTRADIGYLQQVAANQWLPAAQRLGAAAQAAELEASIPGLEASLTDIRIREIGHQYSMRSLQASILAAGAQFGASPLPGIRAQMSAVTGYLYQLGGLSNLTWDQSMQKEQAQASARAQLAGALPSILASGLARLDVGYGIAAIRQTGLEQRAAMLPFGSGGLGVMAQGVQIRSLRLSELQYRWQRLAQEGLLTPESALSIASEQESLMTANAAALASLTYGMEARLPALGINLNGIARFNATQLAGMFMPGPWGGTSAAVNAFGAMLTGAGGGQVANAIVAKLDELIATVREGMQATGVSVPRPSVYTWDQLGG